MAIKQAKHDPTTWYITISRGRKLKPVCMTIHGTQAEAVAIERELRGATPNPDCKIVDLVGPYLAWYELNNLAKSYEELNSSLKRLLPHFGGLHAAYLSSRHLEEYKQARSATVWRGKPISKITINRELKHLMALLRWSADRGSIPAITVKPEYFPARHCQAQERPVNALSRNEVRDFLTALTGRPTWLIFVIMLSTGIRKSEAVNLRVGDVDLSRGVFRLVGKGGKVSNETIPASLVPKLAIIMTGKKPDDLLCPNPHTGKPYSDLRTPMETACKRAGITKRFHPHACRHTYATVMDAAGASLVEIQMRLRHADIGTTRKYIQRLGANNQTDYLGVWMSGTGNK